MSSMTDWLETGGRDCVQTMVDSNNRGSRDVRDASRGQLEKGVKVGTLANDKPPQYPGTISQSVCPSVTGGCSSPRSSKMQNVSHASGIKCWEMLSFLGWDHPSAAYVDVSTLAL